MHRLQDTVREEDHLAEVLLILLPVKAMEEDMSKLDELKVVVHDLDALIEANPELKRRLAEIEARAKEEEAMQLADEEETAYQIDMNMRYRFQS